MILPKVSDSLFLFISIFLVSFFLVKIISILAYRYGWIAYPRENRWHKKPTALYGGIGFYTAFILGSIWVVVGHSTTNIISGRLPGFIQSGLLLLLGSLVIFLFGLWDDIKPFSPRVKILIQLVAVSFFILGGGVFQLSQFYLVNLLVTYFWFVGIINSLNMLDNMDGLSSGVAILSSCILAMFIAQSGLLMPEAKAFVVSILIVFVASLLGFWVLNKPPASIFMGNAGSLFIGYILAALVIPNAFVHGMDDGSVQNLFIAPAILCVPIFDTTLVTITRKMSFRKVTSGGQDHLSHRLVRLGFSEKEAIGILYFLTVCGGITAGLMKYFPHYFLLISGGFILILAVIGVYLARVRI